MALYLISYDLHAPGRNYKPLIDLLSMTWKAKKILESTWLAQLVGPAKAVREFIRTKIDSNDAVIVLELKVGSDWALWNARPEGKLWLQTHNP